MRIAKLSVGDVVVDSLPFSQAGTADQARALAAARVTALVGYLGVINKERVGYLLSAGLGFVPVTLAGEYNDGPKDEIAQLNALGIPDGATVFLDLEGMRAWNENTATLINLINTWADDIKYEGFIPGLYVGTPQPLSSEQLWGLRVQRYWRGQGRIIDRDGRLAEPNGGWCMTQMYPSHFKGGVWVDSNMVGADYKGRTPTMVTL